MKRNWLIFFSPDASDDKKATKIYNGLTSCVSDHHVHVECNEEVVGHLIEMAEPELSGLRQERHAKTIEIAQKEVLTCIGKVSELAEAELSSIEYLLVYFDRQKQGKKCFDFPHKPSVNHQGGNVPDHLIQN